MTMRDPWQMPSLDGGTGWLNSEPLDLGGRVVLVNFWTLTCINWLRQEPYVRAWSRTYRTAGLVVIGVHTPEFSFEHDIDAVRRAVKERGIDYPVVVDNDYAVWRAFGNHYWPALYFGDTDGLVRDHHFGEGRYEQSEMVLQRLLDVQRPLVTVEALGVEAAADWRHLRSPETYLGFQRSERFAGTDGRAPGADEWSLAGEWAVGAESVVLHEAGGSIAYRFTARDAHLVLARETPEPIPFRVVLDGAAPGRSHGADVDTDGHGMLGDGRLYQLVRTVGPVRPRTVEITFDRPGAEAYAFTFG
jgi:thiol-disulfide isomerase/thioredoxin